MISFEKATVVAEGGVSVTDTMTMGAVAFSQLSLLHLFISKVHGMIYSLTAPRFFSGIRKGLPYY